MKSMDFSWDRVLVASVGILLGAGAVVVVGSMLAPSEAQRLSAIATCLAVVVALFVGFVPWLSAKADKRGKSVVIANILGDELVVWRNALHHVVGCLGIAAETNDHETIRTAASACLPGSTDIFSQYFRDVECFSVDAACVSKALKSVIDVHRSVDMVARTPLDELVASSGHDAYRQIARQAVSRAMKAEALVKEALLVLQRLGAIIQDRGGPLLTESPVPEFAQMVRAKGGPLDPSDIVLDPPIFPEHN